MWWRYVAKEPIPKKCHNYFCDDIINPNTEKLYQSSDDSFSKTSSGRFELIFNSVTEIICYVLLDEKE